MILTPKGSEGTLPILLTCTPYDATETLGQRSTTRLEVIEGSRHLGGGVIVAVQDIRGRFRSEGIYAMYRAPRGEFNSTQTDDDRRLGHCRLASEERLPKQWQTRHLGHVVSRLARAGRTAGSASGPGRCCPLQPGRGCLEGRRLLPLGHM